MVVVDGPVGAQGGQLGLAPVVDGGEAAVMVARCGDAQVHVAEALAQAYHVIDAAVAGPGSAQAASAGGTGPG